MSELRELRAGLWRWTARHPEWASGAAPGSPADWPEEVGCILCDAADCTVLIDPLIPGGEESLLGQIDDHVERRRLPVSILTTIKFHRRSRDELAERYSAQTSRDRRTLPAGIESRPIPGAGETVFWLTEHRALVPGDRILGAGGGTVRLCPESWLRYLPSGISIDDLVLRLRALLELPVESILVSHGEPVLTGGRRSLECALDRA
jgi:hypothetical protein